MKVKQIAVIPGDGIGPEVVKCGINVLKAVAPDLKFEFFDLCAERYLRDGTTMPPEVMQRFKSGEFDAIYLGALGDPRIKRGVHARDILLGCRFDLDLYVNLRPIVLLDSRHCPLKGKGSEHVNMVVFRENTEDLYVGMGGTMRQGAPEEMATEVCIATRHGAERIIRRAFEWARAHKKKRVCFSTKANAMPETGGVWLRACEDVSGDFPEIEVTHLYIDVLAMEMVLHPEKFDVIVTSNLFGDIITDLGAALQGGIGLAASGNINPGKIGLFEPVHGSAPDIAGQGTANPLAAILTAGMMLSFLGKPELEVRIQNAVKGCLRDDQVTPDLGGKLTTSDVCTAVLERISN